MAPRYVIAVGFEFAGAIGLGLGLILIRAERRAKAVELKTFLKSGSPARGSFAQTGAARPAARHTTSHPFPASSRRPPMARATSGQQMPDALQALRRAYSRDSGSQPA